MKKVLMLVFLSSALSVASAELNIISKIDWGGQEPTLELDSLRLPVNEVIICQTNSESCTGRSYCDQILKNIQKTHIEVAYFSDIAHNFLIGNDGNVYEGRGWLKAGAHTRGHNFDSIGIAFIGNFNTESPSQNALNAAKELISEGVRVGKIAKHYKLFGQRQFFATISPGDSVFALIKKWPHWSRCTYSFYF